MNEVKYIAKKDTWFDEGTEAELICEAGSGGLFKGIRNGKIDEELCDMDEFDIVISGT